MTTQKNDESKNKVKTKPNSRNVGSRKKVNTIGGGEIAIRGFLAQTLVALLEACKPECAELTLEPYTEGNDKFDFCWTHTNGTRYAVQVKSSQNSFTPAMVTKWAAEMKAVRTDEQCSLMLVGSIPPAVQKMTKVDEVSITSRNLDLDGMIYQAAQLIAELLEAEGASVGSARWRKMVVNGLVGEFLQRSANQTVTRSAFLGLLAEWMGSHLPQSTTLDFDSPKWQLADQAYRTKLADWFGFTYVLGHPEPISLEGIFTDLYLLDQPLAMRRFSLENLCASDELHGKSVPRNGGLSVVEQHKRLFILGKPGAGKTTFLRYLTWQAAQGNLPWLPIFVGLRDWAESGLELLPFIVNEFEIYDFPDAGLYVQFLLRTGNAMLLLDGLDEVNEKHNARVTRAVKDFIRQYDQSPSLITCRVASRDDSFVEQRFKYVEVADFTATQIESYVRKWFACEPIKSDKFLTDFKQEKGLQELAGSPLLLGMLCLAFADSMEFGTRRVDLYEDAIDALLRKWDSSRSIARDGIYKDLNHHLKKRIFAAIAYKHFHADQYLFKEEVLAADLAEEIRKLPEIKEPTLDGEEVLKRIEEQHGIFVERARGIHSFAHLTFQEYFAALAIKGNPHYQRELMQHIHDRRWREVFLLTTSLLDNADDFFILFRETLASDSKLNPALVWVNKRKHLSAGARIFSLCISLLFSSVSDDFIRQEIVYVLLKARPIVDANHRNALYIAIDFVHDYRRDSERNANHHLDQVLHGFHYDRTNQGEEWCDYLLVMMWLVASNPRYHVANKQKRGEDVFRFFQDGTERLRTWNVSLSTPLPLESAPEADWQNLANGLKKILEQRDMKFIFHAEKDEREFYRKSNVVKVFVNYFAGNKLLLDCLAIATVTDREAIRNSLFLPPEESASGG